MFSLIITIISIALVAALSLATLYFGGDAFNQGSAKAAAATIVNQASQINGANTLHYLDNNAYASGDATALEGALVDGGYLSSMPSPGNNGGSYSVAADVAPTITLDNVPQAVCEAVAVQAGQTTQADVNAESFTPPTVADISSVTTAEVDGVTTQFGCVSDTAGGGFGFVFK